MRPIPLRSLFALLPALLALPVLAQTEDELGELDRRCEQARAAALAPIREKMARECEQNRPRAADPRQECQAEMSTWGDNRTGPNSNVIRGLFYDLPECREAQAAWQKWEANRPWR